MRWSGTSVYSHYITLYFVFLYFCIFVPLYLCIFCIFLYFCRVGGLWDGVAPLFIALISLYPRCPPLGLELGAVFVQAVFPAFNIAPTVHSSSKLENTWINKHKIETNTGVAFVHSIFPQRPFILRIYVFSFNCCMDCRALILGTLYLLRSAKYQTGGPAFVDRVTGV